MRVCMTDFLQKGLQDTVSCSVLMVHINRHNESLVDCTRLLVTTLWDRQNVEEQ